MVRGCDLVDPGLTRNGLYSSPDASLNLSNDDITRIFAYLIKHIDKIATVPEGVAFEVIPVAWHHFGELRPCIGMDTDESVAPDLNGIRLSTDIGEKIDAYMERVGVGRLLELSAAETLCWEDVLQSSQERQKADSE